MNSNNGVHFLSVVGFILRGLLDNSGHGGIKTHTIQACTHIYHVARRSLIQLKKRYFQGLKMYKCIKLTIKGATVAVCACQSHNIFFQDS
jgi:hypothetical protein